MIHVKRNLSVIFILVLEVHEIFFVKYNYLGICFISIRLIRNHKQGAPKIHLVVSFDKSLSQKYILLLVLINLLAFCHSQNCVMKMFFE